MKYFLYIFTLLLFISSAIAQDKTNKNKEEENTFEILPDDPVLLKIDSMMMSGYFESLGFNDNVHKIKNYNPDSVPVFDSIIYVTRFKKLNAKTLNR